MTRGVLAIPIIFATLTACQKYGPVDASHVDAGTVVTVRIERAPELIGPVPGAVFNFDASRDGGATWTRVLSFRHDDPVPVTSAKVARYTDNLVAVYMGWTYALTQDGGVAWTRWDASKDLPHWQCCNYRLIKSLEFRPDGTGRLQMHVIDPSRNEYPEMVTTNFGATWSVRRTP